MTCDVRRVTCDVYIMSDVWHVTCVLCRVPCDLRHASGNTMTGTLGRELDDAKKKRMLQEMQEKQKTRMPAELKA